ncbi:MAG: hypothetical protein PUD00_01760 [Treponema berlinense]|uniref:hypothetical protein n=1 Tax=Treponema berlinense TaxID=225004 RepID=UPI0023F32054|nr:hypothetical protein [Treponema berlinense]MDD5833942.1 hypothetical protein [Treponema berlinense]
MTRLQKKRNLYALTGTAGIWIFICILFSLFALLPQKQVYKTVKITLSETSTPKITEKKQEAPPPKPQNQEIKKQSQSKPQTEQKASAQKPSKPVSEKKTETKQNTVSKKSSVSEKPAVQTLQKSVDELMAEQRTKKTPAKKEFDWSQFDDEAVENVSENSSVPVTANSSKADVFEGTAGKAVDKDSAVFAGSKTETAGSASDSTSAALKKISSAVYSANFGNGVTASSTVKSASAPNGKIALLMNDGSSRTLLEPAKPVIALSEAASATIDTTKNLTVRFTVLANGHVDLNSIKITPGAIITSLVQNEISTQISTWRFNQDTSSATASFPYKIEKR